MNMRPFILVAGVVALILVGVGAFLILSPKNTETTPDTDTTPSFPSGTAVNGGSSDTVRLANGSSVQTKDFLDNGVTFEDPANEGMYFLAGKLDYCTDGSCPNTGTDDFSILYSAADQSFIVALSAEPLGAVRIRAEQYLMAATGLSQKEMCALNYSLGTTYSVNAHYSAIDNLGFSFCPGATKLP